MTPKKEANVTKHRIRDLREMRGTEVYECKKPNCAEIGVGVTTLVVAPEEDEDVTILRQIRGFLHSGSKWFLFWFILGNAIAYIIGAAQYGDWLKGTAFLGYTYLLWLVFLSYLVPFYGPVAIFLPAHAEYLYNLFVGAVSLAPSNAAMIYFWIFAVCGVIIGFILTFVIVFVIIVTAVG